MTHRTYLLPLVLALLLLLSLTACGDSSSDDPQSGYETVMDMEFLDGMWSIDGTSRLYFDSEEGFYAYRTGWGLACPRPRRSSCRSWNSPVSRRCTA